MWSRIEEERDYRTIDPRLIIITTEVSDCSHLRAMYVIIVFSQTPINGGLIRSQEMVLPYGGECNTTG